MGLVEVGVGLIPGGGGLAYIARRAAEMAAAGNANADIMKFVTDGFTNAAMAKVGTSAIESRKLGYLLWSDVIVPNKDELLHVAIQQAKVFRQRLPRAGEVGRSRWRAARPSPPSGQLANMRDSNISAHDFHIQLDRRRGCGGEVDAGSLVTEEYLMALERKHFCSLLENPKSQERIMGMLQTGKPVRN
jgi:3-hydroxyacyl-CoA dehydrogenase